MILCFWEEIKFSLPSADEVTGSKSNGNTALVRTMRRGLGKAAFLTYHDGYQELEGEKKGGVLRCGVSIL